MSNNNPTLFVLIPDSVGTEDVVFGMNVRNNFTDPDGNTLTFSATGLPDGLSLNATTGVIDGIPTNAAVGTRTVVVTASDGNGGSVSDTFTITIINANDAPAVSTPIPDTSTAEDAPFSLDTRPNFSDIDPNAVLTFSATGLPDGLAINPTTGVISGTPTNSAVGARTVTVTADDGQGGNVSDTFILTVTNINDAPIVATPIADRTISEDVAFNSNIRSNFADVDAGHTLTFSATGLPTGLSISPTGVISGAPTKVLSQKHSSDKRSASFALP
jgi:hypothetical protein